MNPSATLRRIAEIATDSDVKELAVQLADELELQHNKTNNQFQVALGNAELGWANQLDGVIERMNARDAVDDQVRVLIGAFSREMRDICARFDAIEHKVDDAADAIEHKVDGDAG